MTQRVLYLTESTFDFSQIDSKSTLLTTVQKDLPPGNYHTSLGDLSVDMIIQLSSQFSEIKFEPRGFDLHSDVYKETLILSRYLNNQNPSSDLNVEQFTDHPGIDDRLDQPMLWVFGCSHSYGVGLKPGESTYGQLLAQELNLPLKLIAKPGSSLHWSYRHLLNSPINQHDTVIWQLTTPGRVSLFNGAKVQEIVLNSSKDRKLIDSITLEQLYFNQITLLNTGIRFLQAVRCKFIVTSINEVGSLYEYVSEYCKYPEYCNNSGLRLDTGTDGIHAGPLSHQAIAQRVLNRVQCIYA
jgi:hypothetical protein